MSSKKTTGKEKGSDKEKMVTAITGQLKAALPGLKDHLGEKKFEKRIKKAALMLVEGIKITPVKKVIPAAKKAIVAKKATATKKKTAKAKTGS
jgi:hypothetical protein